MACCSPTTPVVGMYCNYGKPTGPNPGDFVQVAATVTNVDSGTQVDLSYTGGTANNVQHSACALKNKWGCGPIDSCAGEPCGIEGLNAWTRLSDARVKRPV